MLNSASNDCKLKIYVHILFSHSTNIGIRVRSYYGIALCETVSLNVY